MFLKSLLIQQVKKSLRSQRFFISQFIEECIHTAVLADADHFVGKFPQSYDTLLSERANEPSQGSHGFYSNFYVGQFTGKNTGLYLNPCQTKVQTQG